MTEALGRMTGRENHDHANIKDEEDFGHSPTPIARRDHHENDTLWNGMDSKGPTKVGISEYGDDFSKKP